MKGGEEAGGRERGAGDRKWVVGRGGIEEEGVRR